VLFLCNKYKTRPHNNKGNKVYAYSNFGVKSLGNIAPNVSYVYLLICSSFEHKRIEESNCWITLWSKCHDFFC